MIIRSLKWILLAYLQSHLFPPFSGQFYRPGLKNFRELYLQMVQHARKLVYPSNKNKTLATLKPQQNFVTQKLSLLCLELALQFNPYLSELFSGSF